MKECPKCKAQVSDTAKFCIKCGFNIKKHEEEKESHFCPECGTKFAGGKFCPECGYDISEDIDSKPKAKTKKKSNSKSLDLDDFGLDFGDTSKILDEKINKIDVANELRSFEYKKYGKDTYIINKYVDLFETNVVIPKCVVAIAEKAFEGAYITSVKLNEGIKTIGKRAFANCKHLKKINFPLSLGRIDDEAFDGCPNLNVSIPPTVEVLGENIFGKNKPTKTTKETKKETPVEPKEEEEEYIILMSGTGEEIKFIEIAGIAYNKNFYGILQPVEKLPGMEDDEALVFKITRTKNGEQKFEIELDDDIIDAVFDEYNRILDEQENK